MKNLRTIIESLLDTDTQIESGFSDVYAKVNYVLFIDCVGDLLYKKTPYQYYPSYSDVLSVISFLLKDSTSYIDEVYKECDKALNKYFFKLKNTHKGKRINWTKKPARGCMEYTLNMRENGELSRIIFRVTNNKEKNLRKIVINFLKKDKFMFPE